ncbi:hypothetical protein, variant [Aphanomyces invadans]|nr:hypothetical protein, variant [Aphanomyces invadans]ETW02979.1 hypothetical protein, variant [Aphanomyces invadans]|eukprot:XP_008868363.1 hypothetical protein, variant [Aphanomyces invadans]
MASYFQLLHRLQAIRLNCERLVADNPAPSSLEYLEDICRAQTLAFEKLYAWASVLCNADAADPSDDDLVSVGAMVDTSNSDRSTTRLLPQALRFLRGHAAFYSYCVDAWTQSRRNGLLRRFVKALTIGGPSGIPRPIEIHAHDPVRYSGEMLAWVHQTLVGEAEFVKRMFDGDQVRDVLGNVCAALSRPLQVRLHQVVQGPTTTILQLYAVVHVLAYYRAIVSSMVPLESELVVYLVEAHHVAETHFSSQWQSQLDQYQAALKDSLDFSLSAAHPTLEIAHKVGHLIDTYVNSLRPHGIEATELAKVLDPVVQAVLIPLTSGGALPPSEMNVFVLNQLACLHATLGRVDVTRPWQDRIHAAMASTVEAVAQAQADGVIQRSGVALLLAVSQSQPDAPNTSSSQSELEPNAVRLAVHLFCTQLMALHLPVLDRIGAPEWRNLAETHTAHALCSAYDSIHTFVSASPAYPPATLVHTPLEIRTILDI